MNECNNSACSSAPDIDFKPTTHRKHSGVWYWPDPVFSEDPYGDAVDSAWEELRDE
jgi:hypothetical protein